MLLATHRILDGTGLGYAISDADYSTFLVENEHLKRSPRLVLNFLAARVPHYETGGWFTRTGAFTVDKLRAVVEEAKCDITHLYISIIQNLVKKAWPLEAVELVISRSGKQMGLFVERRFVLY